MRILRILIVGVALSTTGSCTGQHDVASGEAGVDLLFSIAEGQSQNHFIRQDRISAHLNLRTKPAPRLIIAFPAGNSGAGLFFRPAIGDGPVWGSVNRMQTVELADATGEVLHGMQADIDIKVGSLVLEEADVGSVRFLRKAVDYSKLPPRPPPAMRIDGNRVRISRERPDGQSAYLMDVEVLAGELQDADGLRFAAADGGPLRIRVTAASGDPLETPVAAGRLLAANAGHDEALRESLAFLTYESKMLAGSWRFLTYFGRDTLLSVRLLMPVLTPEAAEIGLGSVLERLNDRGEVAHEEDIGELAVLRNLAERDRATAEPIYDYDMVDDNLMLAPVLSNYAEAFGFDRANNFLAGQTSGSQSFRSRLARNLVLIVEQAQAFAEDPVPANLLSIKEGLNDGNWRDSEEGLVGGRYPYDVNAVLMPAALRAAARLVGGGLLGPEASSVPAEEELLRMAAVWEANAARFFKVSIPSEQARERVGTYARKNGYPLPDVPAEDVAFHSVALDTRLEPIPIMHSDIGTDLLFLQRPEAHLEIIIDNLTRQFPAGLATRVGVLAANPAYADAEAGRMVTRNHYHGTVVWSWQQAMIVAGLDAQLRRHDLSPAFRQKLEVARHAVWQGIITSKEIINSELWSFTVHEGKYDIAPFGQSAGHLTESNAAQLWSTVFLALRQEPLAP